MEDKQFGKIIKLYVGVNKMLDISQADFVAVFRYKYSERFIKSHFVFSIDREGNINHEIACGDLPVTINDFSINILRSSDIELNELYRDFNAKNIREIYKDTYKVYYKNIKKSFNN